MTLPPHEDLFPPGGNEDSPGSQLYLYRLLHLAAAQEITGPGLSPLSYVGVRKLARRLEIASGGQLAALFRDLGLGTLELDHRHDRILVTVTPASTLAKAPRQGLNPCELERGLIDGALELIAGVPVTTVETRCRTRGDEVCSFEAVLDESSGSPRYAPGVAAAAGFIAAGGIGAGSVGGTGAGAGSFSANGAGSGFGHGGPRTWFMELAARELSRANRHGRQLTVMYIDLDDLGQINAEHGRAAGDRVIKAVGAALSRSCRSEDFLWHHGEDEFAIVLSETDAEGAEIVAQRLSTEVLAAAEYVDVAARISASIGFSTFPVHADNIPGLFSSARSAVYLAKSMGKGRSQVARRTDADQPPGEGKGRSKEMVEGKGEGKDRGKIRTDAKGKLDVDALTVNEEPETSAASEKSAGEEPVASVAIASISPLLMVGIKHVLMNAPGLEIVAEIADPERLPEIAADLRPDLIFTDPGMATDNDFAFPKLLRNQNLPCKFTVFSTEIDPDIIKLAADYAVDGIILQDTSPADMLDALRRIYQGKTVLPDEVQEAMSELNKNRLILKELSGREVEVLRLVAEGKSNSQIANELFITVNTVRFHLANIYQKLSVTNRTEAANYYLRQNLTPDGQTRLL